MRRQNLDLCKEDIVKACKNGSLSLCRAYQDGLARECCVDDFGNFNQLDLMVLLLESFLQRPFEIVDCIQVNLYRSVSWTRMLLELFLQWKLQPSRE